jgi:hypothetical protein
MERSKEVNAMRKMAMSAAAAIGAMLVGAAPAAEACDNTTLSGIYSTIFSGRVGSRPLAASVLLVADGAGGFQGYLNESLGGHLTTGQSVSGSYSINSANCGGTGSISNSFIGTVNFAFSMTVSGAFFSGIETDPGATVTLTGQR